MLYPIKLLKQIVTNAKTITKTGKYALDATQNNPEVEGSLRNETESLSTRLNPLEDFYKSRAFIGGRFELGYVKCVTITFFTDIYNINSPVVFEISARRWKIPILLSILFDNQTGMITPDTAISSCVCRGEVPEESDVVMIKSATTTWDMYIKKNSAYDQICINRYFYNTKHMLSDKIAISFPDELVSALPINYLDLVRPIQISK